MTNASISVRVQRLKDITKLKGQLAHDLRTGRVPKYVNPENSFRNSVLRQTTVKDIQEETQKIKKLNKNASVGLAGIITFSVKAQEILSKLTDEEQDKLFLKAIEKFEEVVNTKVMNVVVHRDETATHIHFIALPCQLDGKTHSKGFLSRPENLSRLQDAIAGVFTELGIQRGIKKEIRIQQGEPKWKWIHRTVRQLHKDLEFEIEEKKKELDLIQKTLTEVEQLLEQYNDIRLRRYKVLKYVISVTEREAEEEMFEKIKKTIYEMRNTYVSKLQELKKLTQLLESENEQLKESIKQLEKENQQLKEELQSLNFFKNNENTKEKEQETQQTIMQFYQTMWTTKNTKNDRDIDFLK